MVGKREREREREREMKCDDRQKREKGEKRERRTKLMKSIIINHTNMTMFLI